MIAQITWTHVAHTVKYHVEPSRQLISLHYFRRFGQQTWMLCSVTRLLVRHELKEAVRTAVRQLR
jgi:hypothetical protein